jgi:hypothetical protein
MRRVRLSRRTGAGFSPINLAQINLMLVIYIPSWRVPNVMRYSISRSIPPFPVRRPVGWSGRREGEAPASPSGVWTIMRVSAGLVPRPPSGRIILNSSICRSGNLARHRAVENAPSLDEPPMSGRYARPTILLVFRRNRIHPSGDPMMFSNSLFFQCILRFRDGQPRNSGLFPYRSGNGMSRHCEDQQ